MQDRYTADAGDFGKYGLLRRLVGQAPASSGAAEEAPGAGARLRLAVNWCLVPDESHNNDGKHVAYLGIGGHPDHTFRQCDPELFDRLRALVPHLRRVSEVRAAGILPEETLWFERPIGGLGLPSSPDARRQWHAAALAATREAEIVFLDPDNGMRPGAPNGKPSEKHIHLEELRDYLERGQSLVVYHHLDRSAPHPEQIRSWRDRLESELGVKGAIGLRYRKGSSRAFFILPTPGHRALLRSRTDALLASPWRVRLRAFEETV